MLTDLQAGTAADVFAGSCPLFPVWEQMGYLLDLSPYVFADLDPSTLKDWDKTQYQAFSNGEGHQFALPKFSGALVLFFNKDLFDQLRLDYPDNTWNRADYLAAMHAITQDNDLDGKVDQWGSMMDISWDRIQVHVNGWGGNLVDPSNPSRSLMASQESLDAMGWIRDLIWRDHFMPSSLDVQRMKPVSAFIQQRVGMIEEGSWVLKDILENASFRVGVTTFPSGPVKKVTLTSTHGYAVYAGTKYPDAAWELVKFLTSHEYGRALARGHLLQPARLSLFNEWADNIRNEYPKQFKELDINAFNDGRIQGYSTTSEVFANMSEALRLSNIAWEQIFTLGQLSVNVMKDVSAQIEKSQ